MKRRVRFLSILTALALTSGCATTAPPMAASGLVNRLKNRGPVVLSTDNPYLAGNLLVSREMQNSPEVAGFVKHRGAPAAIQVRQGWFDPLVVDFFYPEHREMFSLENIQGDWIIKGPLNVDKEVMKEVLKITRRQQGEPQLLGLNAKGRRTRALSSDASEQKGESFSSMAGNSAEDEDPFISQLKKYDKLKHKQAEGSFKSPTISKQTIEQLAGESEDDPAELTPKGDLVHFVTYPGETLSMIARWYTFDRANAGRLARINLLKNPNQLTIGDEIIIPSYLLRNRKRMSEEIVTKLKDLISG